MLIIIKECTIVGGYALMDKIYITPESSQTSKISPIILSESDHVQISFECTQVNNPHDRDKNIKGKLIIKKKNKDVSSFSEIEKFSKKDIRSHDLIEIALDTKETFNLAQGLKDYYTLLSGNNTDPLNEKVYVQRDEKIKMAEELLNDREELLRMLPNIDLSTLNSAIHIEGLKKIKRTMEKNMCNDQESDFWQPFFENNAWILAQLFHSPFIYFRNRHYLGGKGLDNHGGQLADFIFQNKITQNIAIIEIKSPQKRLIGAKYRQTFSLSEDLGGGINQILKQRTELARNYNSLFVKSQKDGEPFNANNVECILIIGNVSLLSADEKEAFDTFRNDLRSVHIIGFDELLGKISILLNLFESDV